MHPDVARGLKRGQITKETQKTCTDMILSSGRLNDYWPYVDEVHTLTSLSGFEALLQGKHVVTYGKPFYAGWGLTDDVMIKQEYMALTLKELFAGVMILYPKYWDWQTRHACCPEDVCHRILNRQQPEVRYWVRCCRTVEWILIRLNLL